MSPQLHILKALFPLLYSHISIFPRLYVPTSLYSLSSMFLQLYNPAALYSQSSVFLQFYIPTTDCLILTLSPTIKFCGTIQVREHIQPDTKCESLEVETVNKQQHVYPR